MVDFGDLGHPGEGDLAGTPGIGIIGAGWIVRECHLPAYAAAGAEVVGITSRTTERSAALAEAHGIRALDSWEEMVDDPAVEVVDIAYPPDVQPELIREIVGRDAGIRGILVQKPLATTLTRPATRSSPARSAESSSGSTRTCATTTRSGRSNRCSTRGGSAIP